MNLMPSSIPAISFSGPEFLEVNTSFKASCLIVASGPSFDRVRFDLLHPSVYIIAVKTAINGLRRADAWMTVDANARCRRKQMHLLQRKPGTRYFAAVPADYGTPTAIMRSHRAPAEKGIHYLERIRCEGLAEDRRQIATGNSAFGALGLAYHLGFSRIGIIGVDATQDGYGLGIGRPRGDLQHLHDLFGTAIDQLQSRRIEVKNAGALQTWKREPWQEVFEWLKELS